MQTKIHAMNETTFSKWLQSRKRDYQTLAAAVMFACNNIAEHGNKKPLNSMLRIESFARKNSPEGRAVREYCGDLLRGFVTFNKESGQFDTLRGETKQAHKPIDWEDVPSFLDFIRAEKPKGDKGKTGVTAAAMLKKIASVTESGFTSATIADIDAITAALPAFQSMLAAAHVALQAAAESKAPSVTDGATGEHSRREAHGGPDAALAREVKTTKRGSLGDKLNAALVAELRKANELQKAA
jgi:hypothetical protein